MRSRTFGLLFALPLLGLGWASFTPRAAATPLGTLSPTTRGLLAAAIHRWEDPTERARVTASLRAQNPEWDFMERTFTGWAIAELALAEPAERPRLLPVLDTILADTLAEDAKGDPYHFLLPYAQVEPFRVQPARSAFVDGEIALLIGARRLVKERPELKEPMHDRITTIEARMAESPVLCDESYPNECWIFCTTVALAAMEVEDRLDGTDHRAFFTRWVELAKARLVDGPTGLLVSSFELDGTPRDGPEGSSIYLAAHMLRRVDPTFAREQYTRAEAELGGSFLGYGYAREWPDSWVGPPDVDSGDAVPVLRASPSASGFALLAAASFGDATRWGSLEAALELGGGPTWDGDRLSYARGNAVGDAVLLYGGVLAAEGPPAGLREPSPR